MRLDMEDTPALVFPRVRRWVASTISESTKDVLNIRKAFRLLRVSDVNWEPYKNVDPGSIPKNCIIPDNVCFSRTWLISFNIREIYVPDWYARQFGQEQHPLNVVPRFQQHHWSASVDWSLEYDPEIKHFQQLISATHCDHTTVPATWSTEEVLTPAATTRASHGLNMMTMVEDIKKEFPIIECFLMRQPLPDEVARALARIHELVESSHPKEGDAALGAQREGSSEPHGLVALDPPAELAHKQLTTRTPHDPETEQAPNSVPNEAMQNGDLTSKSVAEERFDVPMKDVTQEGSEDGEVEEHRADDSGCKEQKRRRRRRSVEGGDEQLRRSNRHCVQIKRFKHREGKGSASSDPILL